MRLWNSRAPAMEGQMAAKGNVRVIHRSSVTGRMVKPSYVKAHPKTTETQHVRVPPAKKGK